jgi:hypothetical protein
VTVALSVFPRVVVFDRRPELFGGREKFSLAMLCPAPMLIKTAIATTPTKPTYKRMKLPPIHRETAQHRKTNFPSMAIFPQFDKGINA